MAQLLLQFLAAIALSLAATPLVIRLLHRYHILDIPNVRSSHVSPVPRGGGLVILLPFYLGSVFLLLSRQMLPSGFPLALLIGATGLAVLGFLDDLYSLPPLTRLAIQGALVALCLHLSGLRFTTLDLPLLPALHLGVFGWPVSWIWVVGFTNMFNFMDGIDGIAGFQILLGSASLCILAQLTHNPTLALFAALYAGGSVGFLRANFPRARFFLGDVGSLPLGFFLSLGILHCAFGGPRAVPIVVPVLLVWPFFFDATLTILVRLCRGHSPFEAHREHLYQRLARSGRSHPWIATRYALVTIALSACSFLYLSLSSGGRVVITAFVLISSAAIAAAVQRPSHHAVQHASRRSAPAPRSGASGEDSPALRMRDTGLLARNRRDENL